MLNVRDCWHTLGLIFCKSERDATLIAYGMLLGGTRCDVRKTTATRPGQIAYGYPYAVGRVRQ